MVVSKKKEISFFCLFSSVANKTKELNCNMQLFGNRLDNRLSGTIQVEVLLHWG